MRFYCNILFLKNKSVCFLKEPSDITRSFQHETKATFKVNTCSHFTMKTEKQRFIGISCNFK